MTPTERSRRTRCRDGGVEVRSVTVVPGAFTLVVIAVADLAGERHFWLYPATDTAASHRFVMTDELAARARQAGWLHTSGAVMSDEPARSTALGLMEVARAAGVPTSLDLNIRTSDGTVAEDYLASIRIGVAHATVVFGSVDEELPAIAGGATTEENLTRARRRRHDRGGSDGGPGGDPGRAEPRRRRSRGVRCPRRRGGEHARGRRHVRRGVHRRRPRWALAPAGDPLGCRPLRRLRVLAGDVRASPR